MSFQKKRVAEVDDDRLKFEISTIVAREVLFQLSNICIIRHLFACKG